jgi:hypothetical protein
MERKVWVCDDPEANYSRCPECDRANAQDKLLLETNTRKRAAWCPHLVRELDGSDGMVYHLYAVSTVRRATVHVVGDPAVGIPHAYYAVELHVDTSTYAEWADARATLEGFRAALAETYALVEDAQVRVTFDYEEEA